MNVLKLCHALGICAAAAMLASCGGSQSAGPQLPVTTGEAAINNSGAVRVPGRARKLGYTITDLGTLGGSYSEAVGVSNNGGVSGYSTLSGDSVYHAFYWQNGAMTDLGTLGGPNSFAPEQGPPNERGEVAGMSDTDLNSYYDNFCGVFDFASSPYTCSAFIWRNGSMAALPTLGGPDSVAIAVNNRGAIVGTSETATQFCIPGFPFGIDGVIWGHRGSVTRELRPLRGDDFSLADAINDKDEAVGTSGSCTGSGNAVLWQRGSPINLGNLGGTSFNGAFGINNRKEVVGQSNLYGDYTHHAFLWRKGKMTDLGSILGLAASLAAGINNNGQIVGFSQDQYGYNTTAWIWQKGTMTDLNTLIGQSSPWFIFEALGINDPGQIVGYAYNSDIGQVHAILATPCGESCTDVRAAKPRTIAVPERAQMMVQRMHHFGHFQAWLGR